MPANNELQGSKDVAKKASKSNVLTYPSKKPAGGSPPPPRQACHGRIYTRVMALDLPPGKLSPAMDAYFAKSREARLRAERAARLRLRQRQAGGVSSLLSNDLMLGAEACPSSNSR